MSEQVINKANNKKITINITTPRGLKFVEKADMVVMRCIDGDLGVLYGHEPLSAILGDGILRIFNNGSVKRLALFGGVAEIGKNIVNIFSTIAQRPEEIDLERAEADRQELEALFQEKIEERQIQSSLILLRRALVRIEVSMDLEEVELFEEESEKREF
jgi:F-type H+-transporting ATPase subunit epsilon